MRYILIVIGIILLYKLIFDFVIPVYRTTRDIKRKFREMQNQANGQTDFQSGQFGQTRQAKPSNVAKNQAPADKDYIDFEEIK